MNKYSDHHKTLDNHKLVKILEESAKYEAEAVESAKLELLNRNFSSDDVDMLIKGRLIDLEKDESELIEEVHPEFEKDSLFETLDTYSESQVEQGDYKKWRYFFYFFLLTAGYYFYTNLLFYMDCLKFGFERHVAPISPILVDMLFYYSLFLFWQKNKNGWIILGSIYITDTSFWLYYWINLLFITNYPYQPLSEIQNLICTFTAIGIIWIIFRPFLIRIYKVTQKDKISLVAWTVGLIIFYIVTMNIGW